MVLVEDTTHLATIATSAAAISSGPKRRLPDSLLPYRQQQIGQSSLGGVFAEFYRAVAINGY